MLNWKNRWMPLVAALAIAGLVSFAAACGDDDDGNADDAEDLAANLEQLKTALLGTENIVGASDDVRNTIKDECDEVAGAADDDQIDDFCDELDQAIDDEDQQAFDEVVAVFPAIEQEVRNQIGEDIGDVVNDDDDDGDQPLEGGDENADDGNNGDDADNPGDDAPDPDLNPDEDEN